MYCPDGSTTFSSSFDNKSMVHLTLSFIFFPCLFWVLDRYFCFISTLLTGSKYKKKAAPFHQERLPTWNEIDSCVEGPARSTCQAHLILGLNNGNNLLYQGARQAWRILHSTLSQNTLWFSVKSLIITRVLPLNKFELKTGGGESLVIDKKTN